MQLVDEVEPLVSMIIPVYNCERSIERCVASILRQTYRNMEIFVVNDGSTDHTEKVLKKYEALDKRVRVLRNRRSGVSASRNLALERASGKYVLFADGDDWLAADSVENIVEAMEDTGADMSVSDFYRVVKHRIYRRGHIEAGGCISRKEFAGYMMKAPANFYYGVLWNKCYRLDIIREHHLHCPENLQFCEDFQFNLEYLQYVESVYVEHRPSYYYVKTKGSIVSQQTSFANNMRIKRQLFDYYAELYKSLDMYQENRRKINRFMLSFAHDRGEKIKKVKIS